ncbi:MAG: helix-turn-helix domain-containing protein [Rhodospirillaceae bacterium]
MAAAPPLTIGQLAARTGVKVTTIRYYETIGLMPEPARTPGNRRLYQPDHLERLSFIRHSRALGLPLEAIRDLLSLSSDPARPCAPATRIAEAVLLDIDRKIGDLSALKRRLTAIIERCAGDSVDTCAILRALHDGPDAGSEPAEP